MSGQGRVSDELCRGAFSFHWAECLRHDLKTFRKHLKALSAKTEKEGIILDENRVAVLEKAKKEKQAHGEIETCYPSFLVAQDTYYVRHIKGVGHIYQQTVINTCSKIGLSSYMIGRMRLSPPICSATE